MRKNRDGASTLFQRADDKNSEKTPMVRFSLRIVSNFARGTGETLERNFSHRRKRSKRSNGFFSVCFAGAAARRCRRQDGPTDPFVCATIEVSTEDRRSIRSYKSLSGDR